MNNFAYRIPVSREDLQDLVISYLIMKGFISEKERPTFSGFSLVGKDLEVEFVVKNSDVGLANLVEVKEPLGAA